MVNNNHESLNLIAALGGGGSGSVNPYECVSNIVTVGPDACMDYSTISAALAAITTASASNRFLIEVMGNVTETAQINAKSNISVLIKQNAVLSVTTSTGEDAGVLFEDVVNSVWMAESNVTPNIVVTDGDIGVCGIFFRSNLIDFDNVILKNLHVVSDTTISAIGSVFGGGERFYDCIGVNDQLYGINVAVQLSPAEPTVLYNCIGYGPIAGISTSNGSGGSKAVFFNCTGIGNGTDFSLGWLISTAGQVTYLFNCRGFGGNSGDDCYGIQANSVFNIIGGYFQGGNGGTNCYGIYINGASAFCKINGAVFQGGTNGTGSPGGFTGVFTNIRVVGSTFIGAGTAVALAASATYSNAPYYNCLFDGGTSGPITCDTGTPNGTCTEI